MHFLIGYHDKQQETLIADRFSQEGEEMPHTPEKIDKAIVTNLTALKAKYGQAGVQKIDAAVKHLIAADKKRGLITRIYPLDDAAVMGQIGGTPVTTASDPKQNKDAIDAVYKTFAPDYLLILGAVDVIPHQDLKNPVYSPFDDPDRFAFGDLPYACEAKYSKRPQDFFGPTRVVGRLPDITGSNDPRYLLGLLKTAATYKAMNPGLYRSYFGISAEIWRDSTALSISATFGNSADLKTVPPAKANWPRISLKRKSHFINCHGAMNDSRFYGQPASGSPDYPVALDAAYLKHKITEGTVVSAECCYGGQLFDPALNQGQAGIANSYLAGKAYGFFGSTTIAYGPSDANDQADLICQYFLQSVLKGASLGRAALEARQKFVHSASMSDPTNVKTIAQFNLLADPSITPIKLPPAVPKARKRLPVLDMRVERAERRRDLFSRGLALGKSQPIIARVSEKVAESAVTVLGKVAADHGFTPGRTLTFSVKEPSDSKAMPRGLMAREVFPSSVHVIFGAGKPGSVQRGKRAMPTKTQYQKVTGTVALIVKEVDGTIVSVKKVFSR